LQQHPKQQPLKLAALPAAAAVALVSMLGLLLLLRPGEGLGLDGSCRMCFGGLRRLMR
jgi:hypothetical protein